MATSRMPLPAALVLALLAGCQREARRSSASVQYEPMPMQKASGADRFDMAVGDGSPIPGDRSMSLQRPQSPASGAKPRSGIAQETKPAASLKLIRTGNLSLEVPSFEKAAAELERMVKASGGYVSDAHSNRSPSGSVSGTVVLRVPLERFEVAGSSIRKLGKVLSSRDNVQDVTREYADLEIRIQVKRDAADRMRELLRSRTSSIGDILEVQQALNRLVEEIETSEGQRRFYDHQVALSTYTVEMREPESFVSLRPSSWAPLKEALGDSGRVLATSMGALLLMLVGLLPWLLLGWGVIWAIVRLVKRRKARKAAAKAALKPTAAEPPKEEGEPRPE